MGYGSGIHLALPSKAWTELRGLGPWLLSQGGSSLAWGPSGPLHRSLGVSVLQGLRV